MKDILVINSGSSSIKFALYGPGDDDDESLARFQMRYQGQFSGLGQTPRFSLKDGQGEPVETQQARELPEGMEHHAALERLLKWIEQQPDLEDIAVVGHRVVHGGRDYHAPVVLDEENIQVLETLIPLAPLHQPFCLAPVKMLAEQRPDLVQVACFDTAFHTTQPRVSQQFAIPRELTEKGLVRYGFHGLSYDYINRVLPSYLESHLENYRKDASAERVIVAHLGNGASMCAIQNAKSVTSTMGLTAVDGLPMGTRCGNLDPGLVLHLLDEEKMSLDEVSELLYHRSGLLGVSGGISSDMRELLASDAPEAQEAIDLFIYRIVREIGSLTAAMGGLDQLVFTAGIGEKAAAVREGVCRGCEWLGVSLDGEANQENAQRISHPESRVGVWVIPTDEERMIAWHSAKHLQAESAKV